MIKVRGNGVGSLDKRPRDSANAVADSRPHENQSGGPAQQDHPGFDFLGLGDVALLTGFGQFSVCWVFCFL